MGEVREWGKDIRRGRIIGGPKRTGYVEVGVGDFGVILQDSTGARGGERGLEVPVRIAY